MNKISIFALVILVSLAIYGTIVQAENERDFEEGEFWLFLLTFSFSIKIQDIFSLKEIYVYE